MHLNNFRNPELIQKIVTELQGWKKPVKFMEVCGSHTMAIGYWGITAIGMRKINLVAKIIRNSKFHKSLIGHYFTA